MTATSMTNTASLPPTNRIGGDAYRKLVTFACRSLVSLDVKLCCKIARNSVLERWRW